MKKKRKIYQIFVNGLTGKITTYDVEDSSTVESVKEMIRKKEGAPVDKQRLIYGGKQLVDGQTMEDCGIQELSTIRLLLRLR